MPRNSANVPERDEVDELREIYADQDHLWKAAERGDLVRDIQGLLRLVDQQWNDLDRCERDLESAYNALRQEREEVRRLRQRFDQERASGQILAAASQGGAGAESRGLTAAGGYVSGVGGMAGVNAAYASNHSEYVVMPTSGGRITAAGNGIRIAPIEWDDELYESGPVGP